MDVMIDIETLATTPDSVILTLGALKFDPKSNAEGNSIYHRLDVDSQLKIGRRVDDGTLEWWGKQALQVREEALGTTNRQALDEVFDSISRFMVGVDNIWAQGPAFDIVILEDVLRQIKRPIPWQFWQIRDSRTLFKLVNEDPRPKNFEGAHNALTDCYYQAKAVQKVFRLLGLNR